MKTERVMVRYSVAFSNEEDTLL